MRQFLTRLNLTELFTRHLPARPGRAPEVSSALVLTLLVHNILIDHQPLYAVAPWAARRVPEHLGLTADQVAALNDDRIGRALDHLHDADRASLLTALVRRTVEAVGIARTEFHQDTTTVTFSGGYANQPDPAQPDRPPRITFGYNKDHRPDLKQLLYSVTPSSDGAVPIHAKTYDGTTTDDAVHIDTWSFLRQIVGTGDFLYVADSKRCTRDNMSSIAAQKGRFLTVMPRTRNEADWFGTYLGQHPVEWAEVRREPNPRRRDGPDVVYHGVESPQRSGEGYRIVWYRSSQKEQHDRDSRVSRLGRARAALVGLQAPGRRREFGGVAEARTAGERILAEYQVQGLLRVEVDTTIEDRYEQVGPGRPGPNTEHRRVQIPRFRVRFVEDGEALVREARRDGLFPLMTNDESLSVAGARAQYKYQPFVEKRHEQLKSVFGVAPVWLKKVERVDSLLWLHFVVELVAALVEREVRRQMVSRGVKHLGLYPNGSPTEAPTAAVVFHALEAHRRHRLLDGHGHELRRFHDPLPTPAQEALELLGVSRTHYGLN
ncbi:IS1634 family transposase [Gemmata algarum]|uniref:IS1634 family transposase n=1 Tax=Gemmata algarum TaxID=2975278 RepID=UPI0039C98EA3